MTFSVFAGEVCKSDKGHVVKIEKNQIELNLPTGEVFKVEKNGIGKNDYITAQINEGGVRYFVLNKMDTKDQYVLIVTNSNVKRVKVSCKK